MEFVLSAIMVRALASLRPKTNVTLKVTSTAMVAVSETVVRIVMVFLNEFGASGARLGFPENMLANRKNTRVTSASASRFESTFLYWREMIIISSSETLLTKCR